MFLTPFYKNTNGGLLLMEPPVTMVMTFLQLGKKGQKFDNTKIGIKRAGSCNE